MLIILHIYIIVIIVKIFQVFLLFIIFIAVCIALFVVEIALKIITFSPSPSISYGFFIRTLNQNIKVGDFVRFDNPKADIQAKKLLKMVEKIEDNKLYVQGKSEEELFKETGVEGLVSYDSDFFGWIDVQECNVEKVRPMVILNFFYNLLTN